MSEHRPFFTRTRLGLALWATTMMLFVVIPQRYWHYPDDLWLRILVMAPAMVSIGLFLFEKATQPARDHRAAFDRRTLWHDLEVILVTVVVAGIMWWKFKFGS